MQNLVQADNSQPQAQMPTGFNPYESFDPKDLFNQDAVLSNPKYRQALHVLGFSDNQLPKLSKPETEIIEKPSFEAAESLLNDALEKEFYRQRTIMYNNCIATAKKIQVWNPLTAFAIINGLPAAALGAFGGDVLRPGYNLMLHKLCRGVETPRPTPRHNEWGYQEFGFLDELQGYFNRNKETITGFLGNQFKDIITLVTTPIPTDDAINSALKNTSIKKIHSWPKILTLKAALFLKKPFLIKHIPIAASMLSAFYAVTGSIYLSLNMIFKSLMGDVIEEQYNFFHDFMHDYEKEYAQKKLLLNYTDLSNHLQDKTKPFIESQLSSARRSGVLKKDINQSAIFRKLLKIPTKSINPTLNYDELMASLALYSEDSQDLVIECCINHQSAYQKQYGPNNQSREFINLVSPPGMGKSYLIKIIAKSLNLPCATVCLAGITPEKLIGDADNAGLFLEKIMELGACNGILFFDELDRVTHNQELLSIILPLLEPGEKTFYSPYFQCKIDVSKLFIIAAGNANFKDEAMRSRFHSLKTVDMTVTNIPLLVNIVINSYLPKKLKDGETPPDFTDELNSFLIKLKNEGTSVSFREAQNKIDILLAKWRRMKLFGK